MSTIIRNGGTTAKYEGTATENDVMSGKTFYCDSKELKTGTFEFLGDADVGDVASGKTFYGSDNELKEGTADVYEDITSQCSFTASTKIVTLPSGYKVNKAIILGYGSWTPGTTTFGASFQSCFGAGFATYGSYVAYISETSNEGNSFTIPLSTSMTTYQPYLRKVLYAK